MEEGGCSREKARVGPTLAALMVGFTVMMTAIGLACALTAHIPLARRRVHGRAAVVLYKAVRCAGLALMGLPYVLDLALLVFLLVLRRRRRSSGAAAAAAAGEMDNTGERRRLPAEPVDWDAIRTPTYEYVAEVVRVLSRVDRVGDVPRV